ncbi:MAG: cation diffusion facilitator family transporter [Desulfurococcaceae archaeon]|jgi:cation diffusion facilitator family transporter|nr:cation diffusion facilitator family transporter [Desulfurococcaceae archaeon]
MGLVAERKVAGFKEGLVSIFVNVVLFVIKFYLGLIHNSIAVVADAVHTLSDAGTSVVVVISFWIAYKPPDKGHPFGHGRAEQIGAVIVGTLLGVAGFEFLMSSYEKLSSREALTFSWFLVGVLLLSSLVKELLARWAFRLGGSYESRSIVGDAWHHRSDAIATTLLALGILVGADYWWVDGVLGIIVSFVIVYTSIKIILETSRELLGSEPTRREEELLIDLAREVSPLIEDVHHIHIHKYGDHVEASLHIKLPNTMKLEEAHEIATKLENRIKDRLGWEATVHPEPQSREERQQRTSS